MKGIRGRGRGAFYKAKYGGGRSRTDNHSPGFSKDEHHGQGNFGEAGEMAFDDDIDLQSSERPTNSAAELRERLQRIDGRSYPAYKDIIGSYEMMNGAFVLCMDRIQSDPFAPPSKCRVKIPASVAALPPELWQPKIRNIALCDFLTRSFAKAIKSAGADVRAASSGWGGEKGGDMRIDCPSQHVLERNSVLISPQGDVEARFVVGLPAKGRSILGKWAINILLVNLPKYVEQGLMFKSLEPKLVLEHVLCVEDTEYLRQVLPKLNLVGFVGNGSILPRLSGVSDKPLAAAMGPVAFQSPPTLALSVQLPNRGPVSGMGIPPGVTLIVGGGFHGKSTLLKALEAGVTNKIPGDGRELVVVDPSACKIRAEDGRRVEGVDISPFISNLPFGKDTREFRTEDASGSTSQAANIMEALEVGSSLLLIDEDTTATNFMIRDARMQALVAPEKEPITPLVARIRGLAAKGVSSILVIGGSGDYFEMADKVVAMDAYRAADVTAAAHAIARQHGACVPARPTEFGDPAVRIPQSICPAFSGNGRMKITVKDARTILMGNEHLDLSSVEQIFDASQTRAIAEALMQLALNPANLGAKSLSDHLKEVDAAIETKVAPLCDTHPWPFMMGLDVLSRGYSLGQLARPRKLELAAAFNRLRTVQVTQAHFLGRP